MVGWTEQFYQRALQIREQTLGPEHPNVAASLENLAEVYWAQGKYVEAEPFAQHVLQLWEQAQGPDYHVAEALRILANVFREQGKYAEAERLYQRALQLWERALPGHPNIAPLLNELAECYRVQSRDTEAEEFFLRALQIWEQARGPEHSEEADTLSGLANLLRDRNMSLEAEQFYQRAISLQERRLDQHHPKRGQTLHNFAIFRQRQGNLVEAQALAERALHIRSQALGEHHPNTVATQALYDQLVQEQITARGKAAASRCSKALPDLRRNERQEDRTSSPLYEAVPLAPSEHDRLQEFLDACCELHSHAWCRSADLWQAYQQWVEGQQERYPLSRGAFIAQLKAYGCRADRTNSARIWHGITLRKREIVTESDGG